MDVGTSGVELCLIQLPLTVRTLAILPPLPLFLIKGHSEKSPHTEVCCNAMHSEELGSACIQYHHYLQWDMGSEGTLQLPTAASGGLWKVYRWKW